jgi:hypothetical protein
MELFGDLSSYNAAATLRVSSIVKSLDEVLYRIIESDCVSLSTENVDDERARSIRNPLLLMFRRACDFFALLPALYPPLRLPIVHALSFLILFQTQRPSFPERMQSLERRFRNCWLIFLRLESALLVPLCFTAL